MPREKRNRNVLEAYYDDNLLCEWHKFYDQSNVQAVDVHHIVYRSHLGGEEPENLISLCRECHNNVHSGNIRKSDVQKIKEASAPPPEEPKPVHDPAAILRMYGYIIQELEEKGHLKKQSWHKLRFAKRFLGITGLTDKYENCNIDLFTEENVQ